MTDIQTKVKPALKFVDAPIHPNDMGNMALKFREKGYVSVYAFEESSVDAFLEQLKEQIQPGKDWWAPYKMNLESPLAFWPAKAPRIREVLKELFWPTTERHSIALMHPGWLIRPSNPDPRLVHDWHKDFDHKGVSCQNGYHHPAVIHVSMYFANMKPELGPTYVIPGSHRDPNLSPYRGAKEEPFLPAKGEVVLWDQRLWHRGSARLEDGLRICGIFGFCSLPFIAPLKLQPGQRALLDEAATPEEQLLLGGMYAQA